jgi:hypothetical protein
MKISAFVVMSNYEEREDPWEECLESVRDWADEIIKVFSPWPDNFSWSEFPKHYNEGLNRCSGDWAVKVDLDYVFPEDFGKVLREELKGKERYKIASVQKFSCVLSTRFYQKGAVPFIINRRFKNIQFGFDKKKYTDLCTPVITKGDEVAKFVPVGDSIPDNQSVRTHAKVFNYDHTFCSQEFVKDKFYKFSKAHQKFFGFTNWGKTKEESFDIFIDMMKGRLKRCVYKYKADEQPKYIRNRINNISPWEFGLNGWGYLNGA